MKEPAWPLPPDFKRGGNDRARFDLTTTLGHAYWVTSTKKACRIDFKSVFEKSNNNGLGSFQQWHAQLAFVAFPV